MEKHDIEQLVEDALDAFWEVVARSFPNAKSGDLSPLATLGLLQAAEIAVEEWIENNVIPTRHDGKTG